MVIGITGGIASGKSIVSAYIKNKNYPLIDSDIISHEVFEEKDIQIKLKQAFDIKKDHVSRSDIGPIVFNDKNKLDILNGIMQERILSKIKEEIKKYSFCFVDVPLLYDHNLIDMFDNVIFVYTTKSKQLERLCKRDNIDELEAKKKISKQMDIDIKLELAKSNNHYIIYNDNLDETYEQVDKLLKEFK